MYWVYILASRKHGTIYIGVTNDLIRRVYQHKNKLVKGFTKEHSVTRLVWFETHEDITAAIAREKELKKWGREWKINLIERDTPIGTIYMTRSLASLVVMDSGLAAMRRPGMTETTPA